MSDSFATLWTVALQAPLSIGFPRQISWSVLPFPFPRDPPDPGIEPESAALAGRFFTTVPPGKPLRVINLQKCLAKWVLVTKDFLGEVALKLKNKIYFPSKGVECKTSLKEWVSSVQLLSHVWLLWPCGLQHIRLPCPSPTPGACSDSYPLSWWCHPTISSSLVPFSSHLQSFPASRSFQMSQFFASRGESIGVSASASVLPMNIQDWFPLDGLVGSPCSPRDSLKSLLQHHSSKASILQHLAFFMVQLSHPYMTTGKTIALTRPTFVDKVMSLLFNMLSRLVMAFLPRSKCLLISCLQLPSTVILEPKKIKSVTCLPICLPWSDGTGCHGLSFLNVEFLNRLFHSLSLSSRGSLVPLHFVP